MSEYLYKSMPVNEWQLLPRIGESNCQWLCQRWSWVLLMLGVETRVDDDVDFYTNYWSKKNRLSTDTGNNFQSNS